jgi:hypothetical protein
MAISAITSPHAPAQTPTQPSAAPQPAPAPKLQALATDTVKISSTAKALQAKTVAPPQILQAAASGDLQAKAQLTKPAPTPSVRK